MATNWSSFNKNVLGLLCVPGDRETPTCGSADPSNRRMSDLWIGEQ